MVLGGIGYWVFLFVCIPGKNSTNLQNSWLTVLKVIDLECPAINGAFVTHQGSVTIVERGQKGFQEPEVRRNGEKQYLLDLTECLCCEHTVAVLTCTGSKQPTVWSMEGKSVFFKGVVPDRSTLRSL